MESLLRSVSLSSLVDWRKSAEREGGGEGEGEGGGGGEGGARQGAAGSFDRGSW
jgi:hypothetical protein